jgi:YD repeat-containing protein
MDAKCRYVSSTPGHTLSYGFDPMGRIASVTVTDGPALALSEIEGFAYSYLNRSRQVDTVSRGGQVVVDNSFDSLGRLTSKTNKKASGGATVNSYTYTLDNADRRTKATFADGRYWDYTYDDAGQLTDAVLKSQAESKKMSLAKTQRTQSYE